MKKEDVRRFFDGLAAGWDAGTVRNEEIISTILDNAGIKEGTDVLDVACGTGVLFPDYLSRGVNSLTGVDISPEMVSVARSKYPELEILCEDASEYDFPKLYDSIVIYNAFPHFPDHPQTISHLAQFVKPGGRFTVAHGMSRERILHHHTGQASFVSIDLPEAEEIARMMEPWYDVDTIISTDRMFQVAGTRK